MNEREKKPRLCDELLAQDKSMGIDERYRKELDDMIDKETKRMRLIKWTNIPPYMILILLGTVLFYFGGSPRWGGDRLGLLAVGILCFVLAGGIASQLASIRIRFDLMKEIKELRLELHDLAKKLGHNL